MNPNLQAIVIKSYYYFNYHNKSKQCLYNISIDYKTISHVQLHMNLTVTLKNWQARLPGTPILETRKQRFRKIYVLAKVIIELLQKSQNSNPLVSLSFQIIFLS